jgi:hypothetical protein
VNFVLSLLSLSSLPAQPTLRTMKATAGFGRKLESLFLLLILLLLRRRRATGRSASTTINPRRACRRDPAGAAPPCRADGAQGSRDAARLGTASPAANELRVKTCGGGAKRPCAGHDTRCNFGWGAYPTRANKGKEGSAGGMQEGLRAAVCGALRSVLVLVRWGR